MARGTFFVSPLLPHFLCCLPGFLFVVRHRVVTARLECPDTAFGLPCLPLWGRSQRGPTSKVSCWPSPWGGSGPTKGDLREPFPARPLTRERKGARTFPTTAPFPGLSFFYRFRVGASGGANAARKRQELRPSARGGSSPPAGAEKERAKTPPEALCFALSRPCLG